MPDQCLPPEQPLSGGNASGAVVRVGSTVRKPWQPTTRRVVALMRALRERGIDLPEPHGRDEAGRLVLDYVPGELAQDSVPLEPTVVHRVGSLVSSIHEACTDLQVPTDWDVLLPAAHPDLLCHNDLAAWNLIIDGDRLVFIDWDGAGPSTRQWDLAYAANSFAHLFPGADVGDAAARLAAFVDGYRLGRVGRGGLPSAMVARAAAMRDLLFAAQKSGREPWATMAVEGHAAHWHETTAFIARHEEAWRRALS